MLSPLARRPSLRAVIFTALATCLTVPALVFGFSKISRLEEEVRARNEATNLRLTRQASGYLKTLVQTRLELVSSIAGILGSRDDWTPTQLQEVATRGRESLSSVEYLLIADAEGISIVFVPSAEPGALAGRDYSDREYVQQMRSRQTAVVSDVIMGRSSEVPQIALAAPTRTKDAQTSGFGGFVTATVPLKRLLSQLTESVSLEPAQRLLLLDGRSQVLVDTDAGELASLRQLQVGGLALDETPTPLGEFTDDRGLRVQSSGTLVGLPGPTWSLLVSTSSAAIEARVREEQRAIVLSTGAGIGISFIIALLLSAAVSRRVRRFRDLAEEIGDGAFDVELPSLSALAPREFQFLRDVSEQTIERLATVRRRQEQLLATLEQKTEEMRPLAAAWNQVGDAIEVTDTRGQVLFANPAASAGAERSPGDATGAALFEHHEDPAHIWKVLSQKTPWRGNLRREEPGNTRYEDVTASPILDEDGELSRVIIIRKDVTSERDEELRANRNERLAALGTMAATVAHEINNPLTYIHANVEDVREQLERASMPNTADMLDALDDALEGTHRVAGIVQRMLRLARTSDEPTASCDVEATLKDAVDVSKNAIRHRARLTVDAEGVGWASIRSSTLFQVVVNLLNNSVHAIGDGLPERNEITIQARRTEDTVELSVTDTGRGMEPEHLDRIFDPFFTTKRVGEGTGLGLPLARSILEKCGGSIEASSQPGVGTTMVVRIPGTDPPVQRLSESRTAGAGGEPTGPRLKILIVDDEPAVAHAISRMLRYHDTEEVHDGSTALQRLSLTQYDLVLSDVMMPTMNGLEFYDAATDARPALSDRWLFMTGGVFGGDLSTLVYQTGRPVLRKPIRREELDEALALLVASRAERDDR